MPRGLPILSDEAARALDGLTTEGELCLDVDGLASGRGLTCEAERLCMAGERERQIGLLEGARTCFEDDACFSPLAIGGAPCRAELTEGVRVRLIGGILGGGGR